MKLNINYLKSLVVYTEFRKEDTFTICTLTTEAGTKLVGTSGVLDPANYDAQIGEKVAYDNALNQLWALEGYFFSKLRLNDVKQEPEEAIKVLGVMADLAMAEYERRVGA